MRQSRLLIWVTTLGWLAVGCGGPSAPTPAKASPRGEEAVAAKAPAPKPPMPIVKPKLPEAGPPLAELTYEARGRRDPFTPVQLPKDRPGLDVGTLKLVGIMNGRSLLALVEAPNGLGYIVKPGDGLGNGHVTDISRQSVTFVLAGQRAPSEASVTLRLIGAE